MRRVLNSFFVVTSIFSFLFICAPSFSHAQDKKEKPLVACDQYDRYSVGLFFTIFSTADETANRAVFVQLEAAA